MTAWAPTTSQVTGLVPAWEQAAIEADVQQHIADAVTEVEGDVHAQVGTWNPDRVINPDAHVTHQRTLGHLAQQAAMFKAADAWVAGLAPEYDSALESQRREFYANYQRALARFLANAGQTDTTPRRHRSVPMTPWATP